MSMIFFIIYFFVFTQTTQNINISLSTKQEKHKIQNMEQALGKVVLNNQDVLRAVFGVMQGQDTQKK